VFSSSFKFCFVNENSGSFVTVVVIMMKITLFSLKAIFIFFIVIRRLCMQCNEMGSWRE